MCEWIGYAIAGILTIVNTYVLWLLTNKSKKEEEDRKVKKEEDRKLDVIIRALKIILYDSIKSRALALLCQDFIKYDDYEDLKEMHEVYHTLGGNGDFDELMKLVFIKASKVKKEEV